MDPKVLSYNGVDLSMSDLDLLRGPYYLTDSIIRFYFTNLSSHYDDDILLVSPNISDLLVNSPDPEDELRAFAESDQLGKRKVVIFAVNDNEDPSRSDGGNHWSLLVYFRKSNAFVHYDSLGGNNSLEARKMYTVFKKLVAAPATQAPITPAGTSSLVTNNSSTMRHECHSTQSRRFIDYTKTMLGVWGFVVNYILSKYLRLFGNYHYHPSEVCYPMQKITNGNHGDDDDVNEPWYREETLMPQQTNFYDCGLYVMAVATVVCEWYYNEKRAEQEQQQHKGLFGDDQFPNITNHVDNSIERTMRSELLRLIQHQITLEEYPSRQPNKVREFIPEQPKKETLTGTNACSQTKRIRTGIEASQNKKFRLRL